MDLLGAFLFGLILGTIICLKIIKIIAKKNKNKFLADLAKIKNDKEIQGDVMIIDAIGSGIDALMKYHGEKVKVENNYYIMCWINKEPLVLPKKCLIPINDSEESEPNL